MRPALAGLHFFGAEQDPRVGPDLVGDLEHHHQTGLHPEDIDRAAEDAVRVPENLLQLAASMVEPIRSGSALRVTW
jgi:hypothetical protein